MLWFAALLLGFTAVPSFAGGTVQTIQQAIPGFDQLKAEYKERAAELFIHEMQGASAVTARDAKFKDWLTANYGYLASPDSASSGKDRVAGMLFENGQLPNDVRGAAGSGKPLISLPEAITDPDALAKFNAALQGRSAQNADPRSQSRWAVMGDENVDLLNRFLPQSQVDASPPPPAAGPAPSSQVGAPPPEADGAPSGAPSKSDDRGASGGGNSSGGSDGGGDAAPGGGATPNGPAPNSSAPNVAGKEAFKALKDPDAFGPDKQPEKIPGGARGKAADAGRSGGLSGSPPPPGGGTASAAARPGGSGPIAAGPGFGPASGPEGGSPGARGARGFEGGAGSAGTSGGAGLTVGGSDGVMGALGGPRDAAGAPREPGAASADPSKKTPEAGEDEELSEDEKKELAEIQELLKQAAENDSLDAGALEGAADQLPDAPRIQRIKDKISDLLAMSGGELTMVQRQEVYALAAQLGLSDKETQALVRSVENSEPPTPSARRSQARWMIFWLWLKREVVSWWRRLLAFLRLAPAPAGN